MQTTVKGTKLVVVDKYSNFDPAEPDKTLFQSFSLITPDEDGCLGDYWVKEGYFHVGSASVEISFMPRDEVTTGAVAALRRRQEAIVAAAQLESTRIEQQIQTLLAIAM